MPILEVEYVGELEGEVPTQKIADAVGKLLESPAGGTWVKLKPLDAANYAENGMPKNGTHPVFVSLLTRDALGHEKAATVATGISEIVAEALKRPVENVHVIFLPPGRGRVAFGGKLF